jgi:predicted transcriptional regulator
MKPHIQSFRSLIEEMKDVAAGKRKAAPLATKRVFESEKAATAFARSTSQGSERNLEVGSIEAVVRLLTVENQRLVKVIAGGKAGSVAQLADMTKRAESNVTRTLKKFESLGLITLVTGPGRKKVPHLSMTSISFKVDFATGKVVVLEASLRGLIEKPPKPVSIEDMNLAARRAGSR